MGKHRVWCYSGCSREHLCHEFQPYVGVWATQGINPSPPHLRLGWVGTLRDSSDGWFLLGCSLMKGIASPCCIFLVCASSGSDGASRFCGAGLF